MAEKCFLCGGRVVNGICTECGMDNKKTDNTYKSRINRNDCEEQPMTHVHEQGQVKRYQNPGMNQPRKPEVKVSPETKAETKQEQKTEAAYKPASFSSYKPTQGRTSVYQSGGNKSGITFLVMIVIIGVVLAVIGYSENRKTSVHSSIVEEYPDTDNVEDYYYDYDSSYDPYQYTTKELSPEGTSWQDDLQAGSYVVGLDIPEGEYLVQGGAGMELEVNDKDSRIYLSESFGLEEYQASEVGDVRLFDGARVFVRGGSTLAFTTENARVDILRKGQENPMTDSFTVAGIAVAGEDFPEGTYDIIAEGEEFGFVSYQIPPKEGEDYGYSCYILMDKYQDSEYPEYCAEFKNAVMPAGTRLEAEEMTLRLVPSERIESENYAEFYMNCN